MAAHGDGDDTSAFRRTTSNTIITPAQYRVIETIPEESDRRVLQHIRDFIDHKDHETSKVSSSMSLIDPFTTTLKPKALQSCHVFLWRTVLKRFAHTTLEPVRPPDKDLPKKAVIQLNNTLRRLRAANDPTHIKATEPIEVQAAWYIRRLYSTTPVERVSALLALRSLRLPATLRQEVDALLEDAVEPQAEKLWECLLENEHLLWNHKGRTVDLYDTQKRLLQSMVQTGASLVELASPPSTGKTVMAAGVALALSSSVIIFCCVSPGVYLHVARLLYYLHIYPTFVFGNHCIEPNFKISRVSWTPSSPQPASDYLEHIISQQKARAFIVDLNLCRWFLDQLSCSRETLLFLDEPTMGADGTPIFAHVPNLIALIMSSRRLPAKVILSSATLPSHDQLTSLVQPWKDMYPEGVVTRIDDPILTSSISLVSMETGHILLPHARVENVQELQDLTRRIFQDVVLLKAYSGLSVKLMRQAYTEVYGKPPPTFAETGWTTRDFDLETIRRYACALLQKIGFDPRYLTWKSETPSFPPLEVETLALGFSPHVPGQTLLVSSDTQDLARRLVDPLISASKIRHLENLLKKEMLTQKSFQDQCKKIKDPDERRIFEQDQEHASSIKFVPDDLVVHTTAHLKRHGGEDALRIFPKEFIRRPPASSVVRYVLGTNTEDWLKHAFLAGVMYTDVRIYTHTTSSISGLMESSLLDGIPVAVVDPSFTYGINVPASNVVVLDQSARTMSRNSLIQFINRVGRVRGTHGGKAFLCESAMKKLLAQDDGQEAKVLQDAMQQQCLTK